MTVTVIIPTLLRPLTQGEKKVEAEGLSVTELIQHLDAKYPGIKNRLVHDDSVHKFMNIYVNDMDIRFSEGLANRVKAGDVVTILPAVAGG